MKKQKLELILSLFVVYNYLLIKEQTKLIAKIIREKYLFYQGLLKNRKPQSKILFKYW